MDNLNIYKEIIARAERESAEFRAQYPILMDLWADVEEAKEQLAKAREKYDSAKKLIGKEE